jgi:hypothetical protein
VVSARPHRCARVAAERNVLVRPLIQTLGLTALMSLGVAAGFLLLDEPWADADFGGMPAPVLTTDVTIPPPAESAQPAKTVLVRVDAPEGGCWIAMIPNDVPRTGCGPQAFTYDVHDFVLMHFERQMPNEDWPLAAIEADGRVVQTVGPITTDYPSFDIGYSVPEEMP